jgi:hypothetical protein
MIGCQISCESQLTRVILEIGSLELHFNSGGECADKFGGFKLRGEKVGAVQSQWNIMWITCANTISCDLHFFHLTCAYESVISQFLRIILYAVDI